MRFIIICLSILLTPVAANAQLEIFKDFELSKELYSLTTIKVDANMGAVYLEGLADTWVPSTEIQKKLGHLEDYWIYNSVTPASGDFNILLVVKFAQTSDIEPNKARYQAFMKEFTKSRADKADEKARKEYPGIRTITGEYMLREVTLK